MAQPVLQSAGGPALTGVLDVSLGEDHTCVRRGDGSVWCWGKNDFGQLGDGTTVTRPTPGRVTGLGTAVAIEQLAAAPYHVCARRTDGTVWCWGHNSYGQLGDGTTSGRLSPVAITGLGTTVTQVATAAYHSCARRADGRLWCWGSNSTGNLGDGTLTTRLAPVPVTALGSAVVAGAVASYHSCARRADGSLWCWGTNGYGELGVGAGYGHGPWTSPLRVTALGTTVAEVVAGEYHSGARRTDESLWCWGGGEAGQLGDGSGGGGTTRPSPVLVTALGTTVAEVVAGSTHTCARRIDGSLWCWGRTATVSLGIGTMMAVNLVPARALGLRCSCGDGVCSRSETRGECAADCRQESCGDGMCTAGEGEVSCPPTVTVWVIPASARVECTPAHCAPMAGCCAGAATAPAKSAMAPR
ncbi:MAG: hypothetical protein IPG96_18635 [Proteobacteria bacterium]|nr:hypothetical protein [Pseudomonadota bacterium]